MNANYSWLVREEFLIAVTACLKLVRTVDCGRKRTLSTGRTFTEEAELLTIKSSSSSAIESSFLTSSLRKSRFRFSMLSLFVCIYWTSIQSLMDFQVFPGDRLMCTTKRVLLGSWWGHNPYFCPEFIFFRIHSDDNFLNFLFSADQTSIPGVNQVFLPSEFINGIWFLFCVRKFSNHFKRLFVVQIPRVTVYRENAEHVRMTAFRWRCDEVEVRGTCLEAQKSMQANLVINS